LAKFEAENTDKGYLVTITSKDNLPIRHFVEGTVPVIDITRPLPPAETIATSAPETAPAPPPKVEPAASPTPPVAAAAERPIRLGPPGLAPNAPATEAASKAPEAATPGETTLGGPQRVTQLAANWA